jgi:protein ImuA
MHGRSDLATLRANLRAIEAPCPGGPARALSFGSAEADMVLGGTLVCGRMHEMGGPAAALVASLVLVRSKGPVLWCAHAGNASALYPPGLVQAGLDPARLVLVRLWSRDDLLHAAHEGLRASWHVVLEAVKPLDLSASRRLQLAAETGGGLGFALGEGHGGEGLLPSAVTRWRGLFASGALWPKRACIGLHLLRNRGGRPGQWTMEWDHASRTVSLVSPVADRSHREEGAVPA